MVSYEQLRVIHLNDDGDVVDIMAMKGHAHSIELPISQIVCDALRNRSHALVLSHTHPSGDPSPSRADIVATRRLAMLLRTLNVRLHDHIIEAPGRVMSFRSAGLL